MLWSWKCSQGLDPFVFCGKAFSRIKWQREIDLLPASAYDFKTLLIGRCYVGKLFWTHFKGYFSIHIHIVFATDIYYLWNFNKSWNVTSTDFLVSIVPCSKRLLKVDIIQVMKLSELQDWAQRIWQGISTCSDSASRQENERKSEKLLWVEHEIKRKTVGKKNFVRKNKRWN